MMNGGMQRALPPSGSSVAIARSEQGRVGSWSAVGGQGYAPFDAGYGISSQQAEAGGIDIAAIFFRVLKYRWLIALAVLIGAALGVVATWSQTPIYRAEAKLEIISQGARVVEDLQVMSETGDHRALQTAMAKIRSRTLAERVAFELDLANDERFLLGSRGSSLSNIAKRFFGTGGGKPDISGMSADRRRAVATAKVLSGLSVSPLGATDILQISFADPNPRIAEAVANQAARSFMDERVDQTSATSELAREFIAEQVKQTKQSLQESERELVQYAKEAGISVSGEEVSLIASNLQAINASLATAVEKRLEYKRQVDQIEAGAVNALPQVINSEGLGRMKERLSELRAEYQEKRQTFKPGFPEMRKLAAQIVSVEFQLNESVEALANSVRVGLEEAVQREADLKGELARLEEEQAAYQDKRIRYTILKREVDSNRSQYETLIGKLNAVGVGAELRDARAQIIEAAILPGAPFSPDLKKNLAAGLGAALVLVAGLIYLLELLNNRFSDPEQVEEELGLPVLGSLPRVDEDELAVALGDPTSPLSESYRSLRTTLQFAGTEGFPATLAVTSSEQGETKSTTSLQLARNLAKLGNKVLLVDCDMRRPNLHRVAHVSNSVGLSNLLTNTIERDELPGAFKSLEGDQLTVVTAGPVPPSPADLLASPKMSLMLGRFREAYDVVILDTPPVLGIADALILGRVADATLVMVSCNQVRRKTATIAVRKLRSAGANVVGAAFARFTVGRFDYSYEYRYMSYESVANVAAEPKREALPPVTDTPTTNDEDATAASSDAAQSSEADRRDEEALADLELILAEDDLPVKPDPNDRRAA